jgi:L-threonylcarbamoyladenylate synthase
VSRVNRLSCLNRVNDVNRVNPNVMTQALDRLLEGELVAFPTETVYGLGADASNPDAIQKIYQAKGRPSDHPVIVHIAEASAMNDWAVDIPEEAWQLAQAFWPGPLTLILKRKPGMAESVSGGQETVGLRCPSHPVAQALLRDFAQHRMGQAAGIAAPSANRFGHVSPTRAAHVRDEFAGLVRDGLLILEGGDSEVGIESTIVDLSRLSPRSLGAQAALLRPGAITAAQIETVLGHPLTGTSTDAPRVSGSLKAHYAPETRLCLCPEVDLPVAVANWLERHEGRVAVVTQHLDGMPQIDSDRVVLRQMPLSATSYAQALYATLREMDALGVQAMIWSEVPDTASWQGVRDRLSRAAAAFEDNSGSDVKC